MQYWQQKAATRTLTDQDYTRYVKYSDTLLMGIENQLAKIEREERANPRVLTPVKWMNRTAAVITLAFAPYTMSTNANAAEETVLAKARTPTIEQRVGDNKGKPIKTNDGKEGSKEEAKGKEKDAESLTDYLTQLDELVDVTKVKIFPGKDFSFYNNMGAKLKIQKKFVESVAYLKKAIELNRSKSHGYANLADTLSYIAEGEKDAKRKRKLLQFSIKSYQKSARLGEKELKNKVWTESQYKRVVSGRYAGIGYAYELLGDKDSALKYYRRAASQRGSPSKFVADRIARLSPRR